MQPAGSSFWGGSIPYARMGALLRTGVATAGTNLGIEGATGPSFALKNPEKLANLGNQPYHALVWTLGHYRHRQLQGLCQQGPLRI